MSLFPQIVDYLFSYEQRCVVFFTYPATWHHHARNPIRRMRRPHACTAADRNSRWRRSRAAVDIPPRRTGSIRWLCHVWLWLRLRRIIEYMKCLWKIGFEIVYFVCIQSQIFTIVFQHHLNHKNIVYKIVDLINALWNKLILALKINAQWNRLIVIT